MKQIKMLFAAMLLCVPALLVTSCLSDNDDDFSFSEEEIAAYMRQMDGYYTGQFYFYNDTITVQDKVDSVAVQTRITFADSTLTISGVPMRAFTRCLRQEQYQPLCTELNKLPVQTIKTWTRFYNATQSGLVYFGIYPASSTFKVNYEDKDHELVFNYYTYLNSNGQYYNHEIACQIYITDIKLDGVTVVQYNLNSSYIDERALFAFMGKSSSYFTSLAK